MKKRASSLLLALIAVFTGLLLSFVAGIGAKASADTALVPTYRLYNSHTNEHFYTNSLYEAYSDKAAGWNFEGIAWESAAKSSTPVYRLYNPNSGVHFYTVSANEKSSLVKLGWRDEGISFYSSGNISVYRAYYPNDGQHMYTTSAYEQNVMTSQQGWKNENKAWNVAKNGTSANLSIEVLSSSLITGKLTTKITLQSSYGNQSVTSNFSFSINSSTDNQGNYTVKLSGLPSFVNQVVFPTWSEANGQDDLSWLNGHKTGATTAAVTYNSSILKSTGKTETDAYLVINGKRYGVARTWYNTIHVDPLKGKKLIALTFDDGPSPSLTPTLLSYLRAANVHATFFEVGQMIQAYPKVTQQVARDGNEVASHSWSHADLTSLSAAGAKSEIENTATLIRQLTGQDNPIFRPPYGNYNSTVLGVTNRAAIYWSTDSEDWKDPGTSYIVNYEVSHAFDGDIMLLHDIHAGSVAAVPQIIAQLKAKGYVFVTISQLLTEKYGKITPHQVYTHG